MKTILDNKKADKELEAAVYRVLHRDLPDDPDRREAELERRSQDINAATLAVLEELGEANTGLHFFGRDNAGLERQVFTWVLNHSAFPFMQKLLPHIRPELFDTYHGSKLMGLLHKFHEKYGVVPTRDLIVAALQGHLSTEEADQYDELVGWINTKPDPAVYDYLTGSGEDGLIAQLKHRAYEKVLVGEEIYTLMGERKYDRIDTIFQRCFPEPDKADVLSLKGDIEQIIAKDCIRSIGVGFPRIDAVMHEHGAARGEVITWMANTGVGKTTMMLNCSAWAISKGYNVAYVVLEGTARAVGQRLVSLIADTPTRNLHEHTTLAKRSVSNLAGDVRLIQPSDEVWSTRHIARKLDYLKSTEGWVPDVICIDYAKFLKPSSVAKQDPEYMKLAKTMDDVKRLAMDRDALVITAQQANREGENAKTVGLQHAAGSYDALQPVDYVITVNQSVAEAQSGSIRLAVSKNRHGREQEIVMCSINRVSGRVEERV